MSENYRNEFILAGSKKYFVSVLKQKQGEIIIMSIKIKPITISTRRNARLRQQNIKRQIAEEANLQQITRDAAKSVAEPCYTLNVNKNMLNENTIHQTTLDYSGKLDLVDSVWAPWSKNFKN